MAGRRGAACRRPLLIYQAAKTAGRFCARARSLCTKLRWLCILKALVSGFMIISDTNLRRSGTGSRLLGRFVLLVLVAAIGWIGWVYGQIRYFADRDEASAADAIAVFGAAEYDGRPSPVLRARLDHALDLYGRKLAPLVITLGGGDEGDRHSEGGVGHDYLLAHGVPDTAIIAETQSDNTEESAARLAVIARA